LSRMSHYERAKHTLPYYGWFVLAASAVMEMLVVGATSYGSGLFVLPLQAEYGLSRADASSAILILYIGSIFIAPFAGRLLDRHSIRLAIGFGVVCLSAGFAAISLTPSLLVMVIALVVPTAMGFSLLGPMTTATLTSRWFFRRRGLALGLAAIATAAGGFVVVPLLSQAIQRQGWRPALLEEAGVFFVIIMALTLLVLRDNPFKAGYGKHPENKGRTDAAQLQQAGESRPAEAWPASKILGTRGFWAPSLLLASISALSQVIVVSAPAYGHQLGFGATASAFLISAFSIAAALTKISAGVMADFWDKRVLLFASALFMPLALGLLGLVANYDAVLAACAMAGVALGGALPLSGALIAARFGAPYFGSVIGWTYFLIYGCTMLAVRFAGAVFDRTGSYHSAFEDLLLVSLVASLISLLLDLPVNPER
jgi:MFS family permease